MSGSYRKKANRGRTRYNCNDNKNNYRNQDNIINYGGERKKFVMSDLSTYTIARFLMGNEVQIITENDRFEGVLRTFDSMTLGLSKVFVFDKRSNENFPIMKNQLEFKEILLGEICYVKMLNINGKLDSVILDQEICQRKQISKPNLNDDKNLVPYFDEEESQLHNNDDEDELNSTMKGDNQSYWYHPEVMLKVNEERFNVKKTFSETMEEYTTQIDKNDPLLKEKMERAERLAKEIENDNNLKRGRLLDDDDGQDEEMMFSAVIPSVLVKSETPTTVSIKLNPNAPEFRPRHKQPPEEIVSESIMDELSDNVVACQSMSLESVQQQQQQQQQQQHQHQQQQQQQHQQQQQMIHFNRMAIQQLTMTPQINPQIQNYSAQRMIPNHQPWSLPLQASGAGQYVLQPYLPPSQVIQHMLPSRPMQQESVQSGSVFYQFSPPLYIPQEHPLTGVQDSVSHLYQPGLDAATAAAAAAAVASNQIQHPNTLHQLRQPHIIPHIPILQPTSQIPLHHQQQQPPPPSAAQQQQQQQQQQQHQQLNAYYQQSQHSQLIGPPINTANFPHLIMNQQQQQQTQLPNGAPTLQGYITNGGRQ